MKRKNNANKKRIGRKTLSRTTRLVILGLIGILLLFSTVSTYGAYQTPTTTQQTLSLLQYTHNGQFTYIFYMKNNTLYNKTILGPGEGIYFSQLVTHINASFSYDFQINADATITGDYTIQVTTQTNLWTKTYPVVSHTTFSGRGTTANFSVRFPIDYAFYEQALAKINNEIGVNAQNPRLLIQCIVTLSAETNGGTVNSSFTPSMNISLGQKTIEMPKVLRTTTPGALTESKNVVQEDVLTQRIYWSVFTIIIFLVLVVFVLLTKSTSEKGIQTEAMIEKIQKKYRDFIVETENKPNVIQSQAITVKSLNDLVKIGEDMGKPIIHYNSKQDSEENHIFYIIDDTIFYKYEFKPEKNITNETADTSIQNKKPRMRLFFSSPNKKQ